MRNGTGGDGMVWLTTCSPFIIFSSASSCVWLVAGILLFLLHALRNPLVDGLQMLHIPDHCVVFIVSVIYYSTAECYWLLINYCTVKSFSQLQWVSLHVLFNRSTNWFLFCHYAEILTSSSWNDGIFACSVHQVIVASCDFTCILRKIYFMFIHYYRAVGSMLIVTNCLTGHVVQTAWHAQSKSSQLLHNSRKQLYNKSTTTSSTGVRPLWSIDLV